VPIEHSRDLQAIVRNVYKLNTARQGSQVAVAQYLTDTVQFVAPAIGELRLLRSSAQSVGGAGVTPIQFSIVAASFTRYIIAFSASHNGAAARDTFLSINDTSSGFEPGVAYQLALPAGIKLSCPRSLILTEGQALRATVPGLLAGEVITAQCHFIDFPDGCFLPVLT
jgi:hypothetical protein